MRRHILACLFAIAFTLPTAASSHSTQPTTCPSVTAIKNFSIINEVGQNHILGWVVVYQKHLYETPEEWTFGMFLGDAIDENAAVTKANAKIGLLTLTEGPITTDNFSWGCIYEYKEDNKSIIGFAGTPPLNTHDMIKHLQRSLT